jgi:hypothetical protein
VTPLNPRHEPGVWSGLRESGGEPPLQIRPPGVSASRGESEGIGSRNWPPDSLTIGHGGWQCRVSFRLLAPAWLSIGFPGCKKFFMPIRIADGFMRLEIDGRVVATAT